MENSMIRIYKYFEETEAGTVGVVKAATVVSGKTIWATAKCAPGDEFDEEFGTWLATERLKLKLKSGSIAAAKRRLIACNHRYEQLTQQRRRAKKAIETAKTLLADRKAEFVELSQSIENHIATIFDA